MFGPYQPMEVQIPKPSPRVLGTPLLCSYETILFGVNENNTEYREENDEISGKLKVKD